MYHKCKKCPYRTTLFFKLESHLKRHLLPKEDAIFNCATNDISKFSCSKCANFETHDLAHLKYHIKAGHTLPDLKETKYKCEECDFQTFSKYLFLRHRLFILCKKKAKIKLEPIVVLTRSPVVEARLAALTKTSKNKDNPPTLKSEFPTLKRSRRSYKGPRGYECEHCPYVTDNTGNLAKHVLRKNTEDSKIAWVTCVICHRRFKDKEMLKNHLKAHTDPSLSKRFKCDKCEYRGGSKGDLDKHKLRRHKDLAEIEWQYCEICHKRLKDSENLKKHMKTHADPSIIKWIQCDQCDYKAMRKAQLKVHITAHHLKVDEIDWFQCESCSYKTKYIHVLNQHTKLHHSNETRWHTCEFCSFKSKFKIGLLRHQVKYHSEQIEDQKYFQCQYCPFRDVYKTRVDRHIRMTHEFDKGNLLQCEHCSFQCKYKFNLSEHMLRRHTDPDKVPWFQCNQCPYKSKFKKNLRSHIENKHSKKQTLKCDQCSFETKYRSNLRDHISANHTSDANTTWHKCPHCDYRAKVKKSLSYHIKRWHSSPEEIQWFKCDKCPLKTISKGNLNYHQRVLHQTKCQWFECDQCQFRSKHKSSLTVHKRNHEKNLILRIHCPKCPLKFRNDKGLQHHMLVYHTKPSEVELFPCDQCKYKGLSQQLLKKHTKSAHSEARFFCALCPYKTTTKKYLARHCNGPVHRKKYLVEITK